MSVQKPRKFIAKREISDRTYGDRYTVLFGEIIEMFNCENCISEIFSSKRKDGSLWWYNFSDFEEVFEGENNPINIIDHLPIQSLLPTKVSIDDLIKLKSVFSFDEIITMIEKGIV